LVALLLMIGSEGGEASQITFQAGEVGEIYPQQCAPCHGPAGEGSAFGPALTERPSGVDDRLEVITNGSGAMPAFGPTLSQDQIVHLVALIDSQFVRPDLPPDGPVQQGAGVYADHCATCHGVDGGGGAGPSLKTMATSRDALIAVVSDGQGSMPGFADTVSSGDIEAMVAFLEDLSGTGEPPPADASGADLFADFCARCHGPDATGGAGPALKTSPLSAAEMVPVIGNGRGAMPAFSAIIDSDDIDVLVAFLQEGKTDGGDGSPTPSISSGADIYVGACSTCHGLDASGGVAPPLAGTRLTVNEVISQVFGAHAEGMPTFEGVLDAVQVQEVARYVLSLEGEPTSRTGLLVLLVVGGLVVAGAVGLRYSGALDRVLHRSR
jgi:mono/diheme cytochrome c family protein